MLTSANTRSRGSPIFSAESTARSNVATAWSGCCTAACEPAITAKAWLRAAASSIVRATSSALSDGALTVHWFVDVCIGAGKGRHRKRLGFGIVDIRQRTFRVFQRGRGFAGLLERLALCAGDLAEVRHLVRRVGDFRAGAYRFIERLDCGGFVSAFCVALGNAREKRRMGGGILHLVGGSGGVGERSIGRGNVTGLYLLIGLPN